MSEAAVLIISLVLAAGSFVYSLVQSSKAKDAINDIPTETGNLGDFSNTQMKEGVVVPIIYGVQFVTGNLIFWKAETVNQEYYQFCIRQVIGMGKLRLIRIYREGLNPNDFPINVTSSIYNQAGFMSDFLAVKDFTGSFVRNLNFYDGSINSTTSSVLKDFFDSDIDRYKLKLPDDGVYFARLNSIANFFTEWTSLPQGVTTIPTYRIVVRKDFTDDTDVFTPFYISNIFASDGYINFSDDKICGTNPAFVYFDLLTNTTYGLGIDPSNFSLSSFREAESYFISKKYALNLSVASISSVRDIINKVQLWTNSYLLKDDNDKYIIKILKDSDADSPAATITDEDDVEFTIRRKSWGETFNSFTGNYSDVYTNDLILGGDRIGVFINATVYGDGSVRSVTVKNEANIILTGSTRHKTVDLTCFSSPVNASTRLQEIMLQESYPFATGKLVTDKTFSYLRLGDVIRKDSEEYNVSVLFRIVDIDISEIDKNKISFGLVQLREALSIGSTVQAGETRGITTTSQPPPGIENVVFDAFSSQSEPLQMNIINKENLVAVWGSGQFQSGYLQYGTDFKITESNRILLDQTLFADDISNNASGLMNIDIYEKDLPEES